MLAQMRQPEAGERAAFDALGATEARVEVDGGVHLRVLRVEGWCHDRPPVIFAPGWVSLASAWAPVVRALAERGPVDYVESREKSTAEIPPGGWRRELFTLQQAGADLRRTLEALGRQPEEVVFLASSLGANAVLEALATGVRCRAAFLIGPNEMVRFPWWGHLLVRLPCAAYGLARPVIVAYLRHSRIDAKREPEQMRRYEATLRAADPRRLKLSAQAVADRGLPPDLSGVTDPVAIAYAPSDTLHGGDGLAALAERLPRGTALKFPSNRELHDASLVLALDDYLERAT